MSETKNSFLRNGLSWCRDTQNNDTWHYAIQHKHSAPSERGCSCWQFFSAYCYTECRIFFLFLCDVVLSVIILKVIIMLGAIMFSAVVLIAIILSVVVLSVAMLSVLEPLIPV
jgi:hypothetical protein